jgi:SSS family solute:Na+ symporter
MENLPGLGRQTLSVVVAFLACRFKGLAFAALAAAIVSSLASMLNSTSTILQWISQQYINKTADDKTTVNVGRISGPLPYYCSIMAPGGLIRHFNLYKNIQELW